MCRLAQDHPEYGFDSHMGYGVPAHLAALDRLGPTVHHRRFFAPVAAAREKHEGRASTDASVRNAIDETTEEVAGI
jgi:ribonuclease HII